MRPDVPDLFVEGRSSDFALLDVHHQAIVGADESNVQALFELIPLAADHDAVSIAIGLRARNHWLDDLRPEAADALEQVPNLLLFQFQLDSIGDVLVLAAAAGAKIAAGRLDAVWR